MDNRHTLTGQADGAMAPSDFYAMGVRGHNKQSSSATTHPVAKDHISPTPSSVREGEHLPNESRDAPPVARDEPLSAGELTAPLGVRVIDGLPVPEALRFDVTFLALPRSYQIYLLKEIGNGKLMIRQPSAMSQTERHSVRLFVGQWEQLKNTISKAAPYQDDRRRSLTANHLLREYVSLCQGVIAPHLDLEGVSTEEGLRQALMQAFTRAAREVFDLPEE